MALHRYGDFRVEVFYFDSPCTYISRIMRAHCITVKYRECCPNKKVKLYIFISRKVLIW